MSDDDRTITIANGMRIHLDLDRMIRTLPLRSPLNDKRRKNGLLVFGSSAAASCSLVSSGRDAVPLPVCKNIGNFSMRNLNE